MDNFAIVGIIASIVLLAGGYVLRAKKRGKRCIGCPSGSNCSGQCGSCNGCGCGTGEQNRSGSL